MYQNYFGLTEDPFSITPDPKYLFLSERHRNGFAHLLYGVTEGGGFLQLTGGVGTGKTLLCRKLLAELPRAVNVAFIFNPRLTPLELVATICDELSILYPVGSNSIKEIVDFLNAFLLESHSQGRRTVVIIDEAQNLSYESLEQIRLLTNLETQKHKLLQIILVGQPELRSLLQQERLRQLAQRVTARYHLTPLSKSETLAYVQHRLKVAGAQHSPFNAGALRYIYRYSGGVPRVINILCHRGMLMAYGNHAKQVTGGMIKRVYQELSGLGEGSRRQLAWSWGLVALLGFTLAVLLVWNDEQLSRLIPSLSSTEAQTDNPPVERNLPEQPAMKTAQQQPVNSAVAAESPTLTSLDTASPSETAIAPQPNVVLPDTNATSGSLEEVASTGVADKEVARVDDDQTGLGAMLGNENSAFVTLFGYWQSVYPTEGESRSSCDKAQEVGLSCIYGRGSWENLAYYNRPAVLELIMEDGQRYNVVATALTDDDVTLDLNGRRFNFSREEIDQLWTGSYIILWRPPKLSSESLTIGHIGKDVAWLKSMLDRIEGIETGFDPLNAKFDLQTQQRVMRFQRSQGLLADGIVGKQTLIQLKGSVVDSTKPVLRRTGG
ncbi:MAG: AAA family ATPase [gamma proteobacterium symbiont of Clathrolucina costata]|nr:AAA family ATPase [Candidatus Thiodiazotropha taylori]MCG8024767.1 AAA family ATPase [Candidatus Thiodiazotropha endolucinida]MCG8101327.1 AAA family ATPase [Candidatus Thiodiazotropha taylori]MCG8118771.1 AAA family ATPase [Candidatus Thiodiazotropha taylori]MCW4265455.1 AAA family ATPase [Candidatus Thiodiazotropha endolucinida]